MKLRVLVVSVLLFFFSVGLASTLSVAASNVLSFAGLNERSGVLFVALDQGLFRKYGLDVQIVHLRAGAVGIAALERVSRSGKPC